MDILRFLEGLRTPFFDRFFSVITVMGESVAAIVVMLPVFWCINKSLGYYMIYTSCFGMGINQFLKGIFKVPRPWVKDKNFTIVESARAAATGYSFPSGHTANAAAMFGSLSTAVRKKRVKALLWAAIALIAFSRLYLGVHSPADVAFSLVITVLLLAVMHFVLKAAQSRPVIFTLLNTALALLAIGLVIYCETAEKNDEFAKQGLKNAYVMLGVSLGVCVAEFCDRKFTKFSVEAPIIVQFFKTAVGIVLALLIKSLLKQPLYALGIGNYRADAIRYFILIIFAAAVWPATFGFWNRCCGKIMRRRKAEPPREEH